MENLLYWKEMLDQAIHTDPCILSPNQTEYIEIINKRNVNKIYLCSWELKAQRKQEKYYTKLCHSLHLPHQQVWLNQPKMERKSKEGSRDQHS